MTVILRKIDLSGILPREDVVMEVSAAQEMIAKLRLKRVAGDREVHGIVPRPVEAP